MSSAVSLPNHTFTGQAYSSKRLTSIVHILSPETDNSPSWISGRERMTVENISCSISTKECCRPRRGWNPRPPGLQSDGASSWATEADNIDNDSYNDNLTVTTFTNYARVLYLILYRNICFGYLLEWPQWGDSDKYPKHTYYGKIRINHGLSYISFCPLRILYNSKFIIMATSFGTNAVVVTRVPVYVSGCLSLNGSLAARYSVLLPFYSRLKFVGFL